MRLALILTAVLLPAPAVAAELWCMPHTVCRWDGTCHATTDEESSVRLHDLDGATSTFRSHAETMVMTRKDGDGVVEWTGTDASGRGEYLIWTLADMSFTYTITEPGGAVFKDIGVCEVQ